MIQSYGAFYPETSLLIINEEDLSNYIKTETDVDRLTKRVAEYLSLNSPQKSIQEAVINNYKSSLLARNVEKSEINDKVEIFRKKISQDLANILVLHDLDDQQALEAIKDWEKKHDDPLVIALKDIVITAPKSWIKTLDIPKQLCFQSSEIVPLSVVERLALMANSTYFKAELLSDKDTISIDELPSKDFRKYLDEILEPCNEKTFVRFISRIALDKPERFLEKIKYFGIDKTTPEGQQFLIKVATKSAERDGSKFLKNIKNFGIDWSTREGENAFKEILKTSLIEGIEESNYKFKCLKNCGIDWLSPMGVDALIEISLDERLDRVEKKFTDLVNISQPEGLNTLIKIAKRKAEQFGDVSSTIEAFGINGSTQEGHQALIEIALIAAKKDAVKTAENIKKYGINLSTPEGQQTLIEITKLAAQQNARYISENIKNLEIDGSTPEGKQALIEIAKLAAQRDGQYTSKFIKNYGIDGSTPEGQKALIEIAKFTAQQDGGNTSYYIKNYGIDGSTKEGQQGLIDIATLAAQCKAWKVNNTAAHIKNYGINDPINRNKVFLIALCNDFTAAQYYREFAFDELGATTLDFDLFNKYPLRSDHISQFYEGIIHDWPFLEQEISNSKDFQKLKTRAHMVGALALICHLQKIPLKDISQEVEALLELRNPPLRNIIAQSLISYVATGKNFETFEVFKNKYKDISPLSRMFLYQLQMQGLDDSKIDEISKLIDKSKFKDKLKTHLLLATFSTIIKDNALNIDKKFELLKLVLEHDSKNTKALLRVLPGIYDIEGNLKTLQEAHTLEDLNLAFLKAFQRKIPFEHIDDFLDRYEKTLGTFRDTTALLSYVGSLNLLSKESSERLLKLLGIYVKSVLEGTFTNDRYISQHLDTIFKSTPSLKEKWQSGFETPLEIHQKQSEPEPLPDFTKLISRSITEGHLEKEKIPLFMNYLERKDEKPLVEALKSKSLSEEEKSFIHFQKNLVSITKAPDKTNAIARLHTCLEHLPRSLENSQIQRDLNDWMQGLESKHDDSEKFDGWILKDSDDPCDLLLCGTEVAGSCQIVSGDPYYNKCLVAYLLDGKNRLLVIKDKDGVIQGRSVFRLLWDGKRPVLFLEKCYPAILNESLKEKLLEFAKERAKALNLPLLTMEYGSGPRYREKLQSLGGKAPYEYVDAGDGIHIDSMWSIKNAMMIQEGNLNPLI